MLTDWEYSDLVMDWCKERAAFNTQNAEGKTAEHPFKPGYNFQAGIAPLTEFPITGMIWYQGESNVHDITLHERLFSMLIRSFRQKWKQTFPVYYVQLSGINRPNWPEFRDSQRRMLNKIPSSGMAVSYDLGDSLDVHPTRKRQVGERLALLALHDVYHKPVVATGPVIKKATIQKQTLLLEFASASQLQTPEDTPLKGFELVTTSGKRLSALATISGKNYVSIVVPTGEKITKVLYAYEPFTRANLYNRQGLPAPTFSFLVR